MILNSDKSLFEKIEIIKTNFTKSDDLTNRLFYMAKNNSIARILREIEHYFWNDDLKVTAKWKEDSRHTSIHVTLFVKDKEHERTIYIKRDTIHPAPTEISPCVYSLDKIVAGAYYRSKKSAIAEKFDYKLSSDDFKFMLEKLVLGANYPFEYESFSSC